MGRVILYSATLQSFSLVILCGVCIHAARQLYKSCSPYYPLFMISIGTLLMSGNAWLLSFFNDMYINCIVYGPYRVLSYRIISYELISYGVILYGVISYHMIHMESYHMGSYHMGLFHIRSYHMGLFHMGPYHMESYHMVWGLIWNHILWVYFIGGILYGTIWYDLYHM